jgi:membrane protein
LADWPADVDFQLAYRLVGHLWEAQKKGEYLNIEQLLLQEPRAGERQIKQITHELYKGKIASFDDAGDWMLSRDLNEFTLESLYQCGNYHLPLPGKNKIFLETAWDSEFESAMNDAHQKGTETLNRPLRPMYAGTGK